MTPGAAARARLLPLALLLACAPAPDADPNPWFRVAVVADPHMIDDTYEGPEGNELDSETIFHTRERLQKARAAINALAPDLVHVAGDLTHDVPSGDWGYYHDPARVTSVDIAREELAGFRAPVHATFGNHDYAVPRVPADFTHRLFADKLGMQPYHAVDHRGWRFLLLNSQIGPTWDPADARYDKGLGSLGAEQLAWLDAQLRDGPPAIVILHHPLPLLLRDEDPDGPVRDAFQPLREHAERIALVLAGHVHRWVDFGESNGPRHLAVASTRYDEDSFLVLRLRAGTAEWELENAAAIHWLDVTTDPFGG